VPPVRARMSNAPEPQRQAAAEWHECCRQHEGNQERSQLRKESHGDWQVW
jgi:hypothetical protein